MISSLISRLVILFFGTLFPAYQSYKAVKTKSVKDYVKWMMYWIVFALFLFAETFADILVSWWMPFYHEVKIIFLIWLLSPYTKGSSILYRRFVHPMLTEKENEIDDIISKAKQQGYKFVLSLGAQTLTYITSLAFVAALKGPAMFDHLRQSATAAIESPPPAVNAFGENERLDSAGDERLRGDGGFQLSRGRNDDSPTSHRSASVDSRPEKSSVPRTDGKRRLWESEDELDRGERGSTKNRAAAEIDSAGETLPKSVAARSVPRSSPLPEGEFLVPHPPREKREKTKPSRTRAKSPGRSKSSAEGRNRIKNGEKKTGMASLDSDGELVPDANENYNVDEESVSSKSFRKRNVKPINGHQDDDNLVASSDDDIIVLSRESDVDFSDSDVSSKTRVRSLKKGNKKN